MSIWLAGFLDSPTALRDIAAPKEGTAQTEGGRHSRPGDPQLQHTIAQILGGLIPLVLGFLSHAAFHLASS